MRSIALVFLLLLSGSALGQVDPPKSWSALTAASGPGAWGSHVTGYGVNMSPASCRAAVGYQWYNANFYPGTEPEFSYFMSPGLGCNAVVINVITDIPVDGTTGQIIIGRNGYIRLVGQINPSVPAALLANGAVHGLYFGSYYPVSAGNFTALGPEDAARLQAIIERLAESVQERQDFSDLIPRCPSAIFDDGSGGGSGGGGDPWEDPEEPEASTVDTDGDGTPDYKDVAPEDPEQTDSFDFFGFREYLKDYVPDWDWGFDPEEMEDGILSTSFTFEIPHIGNRTFHFSTLYSSSDPLTTAMESLRVIVRSGLLALVYFALAQRVISDLWGAF